MRFIQIFMVMGIFSSIMNPSVGGDLPPSLPETSSPTPQEQSPVVCPPNTDPDNCLPLNPKERDAELEHIYSFAIPLLISWDLAHDYVLKSDLIKSMSDFSFLSQFVTAVPGNPYRRPGADKFEIIPNSAKSWKWTLEGWREGLVYRETLIKLAENILTEAKEKQSITVRGTSSLFLAGLLTGPSEYTVNDFQEMLVQQQEAQQALVTPEKLQITSRPLKGEERKALEAFLAYQKKQADIFRTFLTKFGGMSFKDAILEPDIKSYYLSGIQPAHKLINVEALQGKERGDAEVIVFDTGYGHSSKHLKISSNFSKKQAEDWDDEDEDEGYPHEESVSGVLAAKEELAQLKGVAPGARVLPIAEVTPQTLKEISRSPARVINISREFKFPISCAPAFEKWNMKKSNPQTEGNLEAATDPNCKVLWEFAELVKNKDILIVISAGNEALQLEKVNWSTGKIQKNLTYNVIGDQYYSRINSSSWGFWGDKLDLTAIFDQIPQLKDRIVLAGNLWGDGMTISSDSSLPGAFPDDYIFAPSEGIATLGETFLGMRVKAKRDPNNPDKRLKDENGKIIPELDAQGNVIREEVYSGIGEFGGTSGAAPRISGVFVLLGKLFPDLSMPEIRKCVLETGDAFWLEPHNRFTWLAGLAKKSGYDLKHPKPTGENAEIWQYLAHLYGRGRINAMAAYEKCSLLQEAKRQKGISRSGLDLAIAKKPLKKKT